MAIYNDFDTGRYSPAHWLDTTPSLPDIYLTSPSWLHRLHGAKILILGYYPVVVLFFSLFLSCFIIAFSSAVVFSIPPLAGVWSSGALEKCPLR